MTNKLVCSRVVEFPEGSVSIYGDGTARFFFRNMDYVSKPGGDWTDGMAIVVSKEVADVIEALFKRTCWP